MSTQARRIPVKVHVCNRGGIADGVRVCWFCWVMVAIERDRRDEPGRGDAAD
jgi:hypothetical protein